MFSRRFAALAVLAFLTVGATPARAAGPSCGSVVTHSTTLPADLANCAGDGLVVGADGITLDLAGHTVDGSGSPDSAGVRLAGHRGVTIENGTLQEFNNGLLLDAATANRIRRITVHDSVARGVQLQNGSDENRLESVDSSHNGRSGFGIADSGGNVLLRLSASDNPFSGLHASGADGNVVDDGVFTQNGSAGIDFGDGSDGNRVSASVAADNGEVGLSFFDGDRNVATANRVRRNGDNMIVMGDHDVVTANVVTDADGCPDGCGTGISFEGGTGSLIAANVVDGAAGQGIRVDEFASDTGRSTIGNVVRDNVVLRAGTDGIAVGTSHDENSGTGLVQDNLLEANLVTGSGQDGIHLARAANTVTRNVALRNGALGIEAVAGTIDGGGNIAHANGDPLQCLRIACR
jgi:hypothetical protein